MDRDHPLLLIRWSGLRRMGLIIWAAPTTMIGLLAGGLGLMTGGRAQVRRGCIEFHGGAVRWLLRHATFRLDPLAMTLGHSILGQSAAALDIARDHEHVHVRQCERWGLLFPFAYLGISLWLWLIGRDAYRDNPFEVEAYLKTPRGFRSPD
jgi:hypothetical protein